MKSNEISAPSEIASPPAPQLPPRNDEIWTNNLVVPLKQLAIRITVC
ncbi:hypothetical protein F441_21195 [Phytophthora nicotianae CJ01A1]|uniref:Uncharacterized protein n=5 Tax=Phytophthora nicotianae TaxID=4792 RepID=W2PFA7_PHYN3|nr:hypothetical protein PPTG_24380 [Phytophthora nicotianae INRA-310]ETI31782.1 hypothetical protein F443_21296 [Phytophthora nicotianae P1569]ETO60501.1 hypothetical protein F444_21314 [Phytophthora nicotianae P1976]ETP01601.1 hypothetical protein F441_21195 [Phytophthora nicotianae CJ01A1]ETP29755.1 hypothetical protein F442_21132 [Phytophthora nicotianae P10297]ETM99727.1 hypothetical protein PPTG_24380 [Phytophthora nicotianae INRA-310]